jgi:hypothetical protein
MQSAANHPFPGRPLAAGTTRKGWVALGRR